MNCYECAARAMDAPAVAVCVDCGVALCIEHAEVTPRRLTRTGAMNRTVVVGPATRTVRCHLCRAAVDAATAPHGPVAARSGSPATAPTA
ncbi:DUF2180 family protein [Kineosporia sp. A_224]|uniref:DUF2180 family protein n=1 Tax=Kineosporia sp. A_224 TaxID=1962180 RepID=UPI000B4B9571|nr:DUF2180 family protein [Kineosporia sp. A_224]